MEKIRVWGSCDNGDIEIISITRDLVEETILLMRNSFLKHENISRACDATRNLKSCQECEMVLRSCFENGASLVAVEKSTGKVVGAMANKIYTKKTAEGCYEKYIKQCTQNTAIGLYQWLADCSKMVDPFKIYDTDCVIDLGFIDVHENYRGKQIGYKLMECSIDLAKKLLAGENVKVSITDTKLPLEPVPNVVTAMMTSFISQKISEKLKFDILKIVSYDNFYFEGKSFTEILKGHTKDVWLVAKSLK